MKVSRVSCLTCNGQSFVSGNWVQIKYIKTGTEDARLIHGQLAYIGHKYISICIGDWIIVPSGENTRDARMVILDEIIWIGQGVVGDYKWED